MRKNIENSPGPRRGAFLKRAARWALSLKWVDWVKRLCWLVKDLVPWVSGYIAMRLSENSELVNTALTYIG